MLLHHEHLWCRHGGRSGCAGGRAGPNGATVSIAATPATGLKAGDTVSLASTITGLGAGRNIASYAWSVVDGGGIVSGAASGGSTATASFVPSGAGSFTARVLMTDDLGFTYAQQLTVSVAGRPAPAARRRRRRWWRWWSGQRGWLLLILLAALALPRGSGRRGAAGNQWR